MWWTRSLYFVFCLYLCLCCIVSVSLPNFRWIKIYIYIIFLCPAMRPLSDGATRLSVPSCSCLGYRHAGCLQLSRRWTPEMCGLRTRPRTDVDPPRSLPPSNCHRRRGHKAWTFTTIIVSPPPGDTSYSLCPIPEADCWLTHAVNDGLWLQYINSNYSLQSRTSLCFSELVKT